MKYISKNTTLQLLVITVLTSAIIGYRYQTLLVNLGEQKTSDIYRDGIKTILNTTYHAKYSESYTWFGGMNYPYKEHIMAATELPGFAILFKFFYPSFPWIADYSFGIIHLFLLLSMLLGCIFIYFIFKELNIPWYLAGLFAIAITFMAPQNMRLSSHMGLAPLFVLPSILYFLLRLEKTKELRYAVLLGAFTFIAAFLHFYFFAIIAIFVSLYFFASGLGIILMKTKGHKPYTNSSTSIFNSIGKLLINFSIGILIPLAFFIFWMLLNDPVSDRSPNPYGFLVYHSNFTNIFSSPHLPLYTWINDKWFYNKTVDFEGWSYVGLTVNFFLITILLKWIISQFKFHVFSFIPKAERPFIINLLFAGGVMAYLSCSQPFIMEGWEYFLQYTGPYKQFRSTGRFAWAFYFSINIIAFTGFYYLFRLLKNNKTRFVLLIALIAISFYEAYTFHTNSYVYRHYNVRYAPELEPGKDFPTVTNIDFSKYQAIIPSPLFLVGTNNIEIPGSAYIIQQSLVLSNQTGLPVTGAMLTRSSHGRGLNQMQLVTEPYRKPALLNDIKSNKPFVLLESATDKKEYAEKFGHLKKGAKFLAESERWRLYELPIESFTKRIDSKIASIKNEMQNDTLYHMNEFLSTDSVENFIYEDFNGFDCEQNYFTEGCYTGIVGKENYLFTGQLPNASINQEYGLLFWVNVSPDRFATTLFKVTEKFADGRTKVIGQTNPAWGYQVFDNNGWVLMEIPFRISSPENEITISFKKQEDYDTRFISVDELLIKPTSTSLYQNKGGVLWKNNRIYFQ